MFCFVLSCIGEDLIMNLQSAECLFDVLVGGAEKAPVLVSGRMSAGR